MRHTNVTQAQPATVALFVSDIHMCTATPRTNDRFLRFLREEARHTQALYLLGDLFESWIGDDDRFSPLHQSLITALAELNRAGVKSYWIAGNRDFLVGPDFLSESGLIALPELARVELAGVPLLLAHGDAQCTEDLPYLRARALLRSPAWRTDFLARSRSERARLAHHLREESQITQHAAHAYSTDVNAAEIDRLCATHNTRVFIHGHTHRPARHTHAQGVIRLVLPDWDFDHAPHRGGWLALDAHGSFSSASAAA